MRLLPGLAAVLAALAATAPAAAPGSAPSFHGTVRPIPDSLRQRMTSWHPGCPVGLDDLRLLTLSFWGFDRRPHSGRLVVHEDVARGVVSVFRTLYDARFPIRRMRLVDAYGSDDFRSIEADNTSAFNCRRATGSSSWSEHAYGRAIDLDPIENPYVSDGRTSHRASRRYLDRSGRLPGMVHDGDVVVRAFAAIGWGWGGRWGDPADYQHFSASGR
jgi:hypothetical protein